MLLTTLKREEMSLTFDVDMLLGKNDISVLKQ